jgi:hypothetical protein
VATCFVSERDALYRLPTANSLGAELAKALSISFCGTAVIDTDLSVTKNFIIIIIIIMFVKR